MTPHPLKGQLAARVFAGLAVALGALTAYLLMPRSHAEELGGGTRVLVGVAGGELAVSATTSTVCVLVVGTAVFGGAWCRRAQAHERAEAGR